MALLRYLVLLYIVAVVLVVAFSWFPQPPGSPAHRFFLLLRRVTDPVLTPVRRVVPPIGQVDLSPTIVLIALFVIYGLIPS